MFYSVEGDKCIQDFSRKLGAKRPLGGCRRRCENNIKMYLNATGYVDVNWIHLAQDRDQWQALLNAVMDIRVT